MAKRARKAAKRAKAPKRAKSTRKPPSTAVQSARPRSRKPKSGERQADKPKSETARLKNLLRAAEDRQTATADILKVIASSPSDVQPVFDAIAASGQRLVGGFSTSVLSIVGDMLYLSAFTPTNPEADAALKASFPRPLSWETWNERIRNGETIEIPDVETDPIVPESSTGDMADARLPQPIAGPAHAFQNDDRHDHRNTGTVWYVCQPSRSVASNLR